MIRLPTIELTEKQYQELADLQALVNSQLGYSEQINHAKNLFRRENRIGNPLFDDVKVRLETMCSGSRRCVFCEDSLADEVEHFRPKSLFPEMTFVWENYVFACGPCNLKKLNRFALLVGTPPIFAELDRKSGIAPPFGTNVCVHPRQENAMEFLELDLGTTLRFVPMHASGSLGNLRAKYTIDLLGLNKDVLTRSRSEAYRNYVARMREYITLKGDGANPAELETLKDEILKMCHPTVFREMQRQRTWHAILNQLFSAIPEALIW